MPVPKQERTTSNTDPQTVEQVCSQLPDQQAFHKPLRALTRSAVRMVLEDVMREELKQFLEADWGESTPQRKGYRNGTYTRDLATSSGPIEDLHVPRDREGTFQTQVFERYNRYEPQVAEGLTQMFVAGVSPHKVGEVAQTLMGVAPRSSTVSRLNQTLTQQCETWRGRPLQAHWRILYWDGIHFTRRHGDQTDATLIFTALGVDLEGNKEVLAMRACAEEDKAGWMELRRDLRARKATQVDLIVTDGHDGLLAAVSALFTATPRQRCVVPKQRTVMNALPKRDRSAVATELAGIWKSPAKEEALTQLAAFQGKSQKRYPEAVRSLMEDEEPLLTVSAFPQVMHRYLRTTNAIESFFSQVRGRTDQIDAFTTETSCLTSVWAVMQGIRVPKIPVS
jgi:putative transposase